jgi:hypothetical protein
MKVYLPLMIQDPLTAPFASDRVFEGIHIDTEKDLVSDFADGPSTSHVVVEDFDGVGQLLPPVKYMPPGKGRKMGRYAVPDDIYAPDFIRTSVLGMVLKTMRLFSEPSALGREIKWAFPNPQLRVLPRAGEGSNAFYERESGTLQFLYFKNPHSPEQTIYTSLSRDIVAHETGHALIDAIVPALYDALTPQSLAVHEAIADMTAVITAMRSNNLTLRVLERTRGSIRNPTAFSSLAPEFGKAMDKSGRAGSLRSLWNDKTLDPADTSRDENNRPNRVDPADPHALSEVLSGALYRTLVRMQEKAWKRYGGDFSSSGRALAEAITRFQRIVFRAIDYLPPGEASFAEYGRALSLEVMTSFSSWDKESDWLAEELKRRHVIGGKDAIQREEPEKIYSVKTIDVDRLIRSDSEADQFVKKYRDVFNIPPRVPFTVYPRTKSSKGYGWGKEWDTERSYEVLLKVSWEQVEEDAFDKKFPTARKITCGTTVKLTTDGSVGNVLTTEVETQKPERDRMVRSLLEKGLLQPPAKSAGPNSPAAPIRVEAHKGVMKVRGAGRLLHFQRPV